MPKCQTSDCQNDAEKLSFFCVGCLPQPGESGRIFFGTQLDGPPSRLVCAIDGCRNSALGRNLYCLEHQFK